MFGKLIAFEGIDGVGKTSHLKATSAFLNQMNIDHIATQELAGNDIRQEFRKLLMNNIDSIEELLVISAARRWHNRNIIQPALLNNKVILLDRFIESTWAYQVGGRGIRVETIEFLESNTWGTPKPILTIYIHGKVHRQDKFDRFDKEDPEFFQRVNAMYLSRMDSSWVVIDSGRNFEENQSLIEANILKRL